MDELFGAGVDAGSGFVEDEHGGIGKHGAGDGKELAFAAGEMVGILGDFGVVAFGEALNDVVDVGAVDDAGEFASGGGGAAEKEVFFDGAREEPRILEDHAEEFADVASGHGAGVNVVDSDGARGRVVEAHEEVDEGGFASAGGADDSDDLAWFDFDREILDGWFVWGVAEVDVVEVDFTADFFNEARRFGVEGFFGGVEKAENAFAGGDSGLEDGGDLGGGRERAAELVDILDEGLDVADGDLAMEGFVAAEEDCSDVAEVRDELHGWHHEAGEELGEVAAFFEAVVFLLEVGDGGGFAGEGADEELAGVGFFDVAVKVAEFASLGAEVFLGAFGDEDDDDGADRDGEEGDEGKRGADDDHHDSDADDCSDGGDDLLERLLKGGGDGFEVIGDNAEDVTVRALVEVADGEVVDFGGEVVSEVLDEADGDFVDDEAGDDFAEEAGDEEDEDLEGEGG